MMQESGLEEKDSILLAAVRLGEAASIGAGCWVGLPASARATHEFIRASQRTAI